MMNFCSHEVPYEVYTMPLKLGLHLLPLFDVIVTMTKLNSDALVRLEVLSWFSEVDPAHKTHLTKWLIGRVKRDYRLSLVSDDECVEETAFSGGVTAINSASVSVRNVGLIPVFLRKNWCFAISS